MPAQRSGSNLKQFVRVSQDILKGFFTFIESCANNEIGRK